MKYLITDTEDYTLGEILGYFSLELKKTNLTKEDIVVEEKLKAKIATMELDRIFSENGITNLVSFSVGCIHLNQTGNTIEFSENEIQSRFNDIFERTLNYLNGLEPIKGTLRYSIGTSRSLEEVKEDYKDYTVVQVGWDAFEIVVPLSKIDPNNPYKAMEDYQRESGEDCFEVFSIELEDGRIFTEEDYKED